MNKGFKTELKPNNKQITMLKQHCGTARFAYNWGLAKRIQEYELTGKSSNAIEQHKQLNKLKKDEFSWMYNVSKCAPQEALRDLDNAYKKFFRDKKGFPNFKSKKNGEGSFRLTGSIKIESNKVKLPRIGYIRLKEKNYLPIEAKVSQITISEKAGKWFISFNIEKNDNKQQTTGEILGIDLGINKLATLSNKTVFENPNSLKKQLKQLAHLQKNLSRTQKGSKNRKKAILKITKLHVRIANIRKDAIHKITTEIVKTKPSAVVMEDLAVSNMMKNHCLARSIADSSFGEFKRQMEYKLGWIGSKLILADRFYPSSKLCSNCGNRKDDLTLENRVYNCNTCGISIDRDLNASLNLVKYLSTGSLLGTKVCGESVRLNKTSNYQAVSKKQKINRKFSITKFS